MFDFFVGRIGPIHRTRTAAVLTVLLVVTAMTAASTSSALGAPSGPALSVPHQVESQQNSAPDVASAQKAALTQGSRVEVLSERTETATTWANPDGSFTTDESAGAIRIADDEQESGWRDLDYTLEVKADGTIGPKSGYMPITLSGRASDEEVQETGVVTSTGARGKEVQFGWDEALPEPELDGPRATYADVQPSVDLVIELTATGFEQFFVLKKKPTFETNIELRVPLRADGLKASEKADGSIDFTDVKNRLAGTIDAPLMWDSSVQPGSGLPGNTAVLDMELKVSSSGDRELVLTPDSEFLKNDDLKYPIIIDPVFTGAPAFDTFVRSDFPTTDYGSHVELQVGTYNGGTTKARSYLTFGNSGWRTAAVTSATLKLYNFHSWSCTAASMTVYASTKPTAATRWASQPSLYTAAGYFTSISTAKGYNASCADGYISIPVTSLAQKQSTTSATTVSYALRASETANTGWKRFNSANATSNKPSLSVTYNRYPSTPTTTVITPSQTAAGVLSTSSLRPIFTAKSTDPDGANTSVKFEIHSAAVATSASLVAVCQSALVISGVDAPCQLPVTAPLTDDTEYWVRAQSSDTAITQSVWSPMLKFVTSTGAPETSTIWIGEPEGVSPEDGGTISEAAVLSVAAGGPQAESIRQRYVIGTSPDVVSEQVAASTWAAPGAYLVPAIATKAETEYYWFVEATDVVTGELKRSPIWNFAMVEPIPGQAPSELNDIILEAQEAPEFSLMSRFEWDLSTQTLEVHYLDNLPEVMLWLEPILDGYQHSFIQDEFEQADFDQAFDLLIDSDSSERILSLAASDAFDGIVATIGDPEPDLSVGPDGDDSGTAPGSVEELAAEFADEPAEIVVTTPSGELKSIPITYVQAADLKPMKSRVEDQSPFAGGGWIHVLDTSGNNYGVCTSGFPIYNTDSGLQLMVTASHCGKEDYAVWNAFESKKLGTMLAWNNQGDDIQVVMGGKYDGRIYTGGTTSTTTKPVVGSARPYKGQALCMGGAHEGQVCKGVVTDVSSTNRVKKPVARTYEKQVTVKRSDGKALFGPGDSGGPVYYSTKKGLVVVGVISIGYVKYATSCIGDKGPSNAPRTCYSRGSFANIYNLYKDHPLYATIKGK